MSRRLERRIRQLTGQRDTIQEQKAANDRLLKDWQDQKDQLDRLQRQYDAIVSDTRVLHERLETQAGQIEVLRSDRDRLTAAIEVMARRHASPAAESDPSRAGWRHAQRPYLRSEEPKR